MTGGIDEGPAEGKIMLTSYNVEVAPLPNVDAKLILLPPSGRKSV